MAQPFLSDNKDKENVAAKAAAFFFAIASVLSQDLNTAMAYCNTMCSRHLQITSAHRKLHVLYCCKYAHFCCGWLSFPTADDGTRSSFYFQGGQHGDCCNRLDIRRHKRVSDG